MTFDEKEMLEFLGIRNVDEFFSDIPEEARVEGVDLPKGMDELDVVNRVKGVIRQNRTAEDMPVFLGAGIYDHYVPAAVDAIVARSEFYTSYTPYQAEMSQGLLQTLFEYQSLICELTGMDAANSSMYDGASALGEAALMSHRLTGKSEIVVPRAMHRDKKLVLRSYCTGPEMRIKEVGYSPKRGTLDLEELSSAVTGDTAAVYVENPNFFGIFEENVHEIKEVAGEAILVVAVNPISLGLASSPGDYGADIVVGEGQVLGSSMNFGGPTLGIFACKEEYVRKMPGRLVGLTEDSRGKRAFCMTLQTREQHIRMDKAMSNICTNESLLAVAAAVYIALLGRSGLRQLAERNVMRARGLMERIDRLDNFEAPKFEAYHFNEFVVRSSIDYGKVHRALLKRGVHGGLPLEEHFPELKNCALFATTEAHRDSDYDALISALEAVS